MRTAVKTTQPVFIEPTCVVIAFLILSLSGVFPLLASIDLEFSDEELL